ncbi:MAG: hypothetical protein QG663_1681 [Thermodesulfobacteriota bacterium]|nr:hypothetical protein [Thermodesulfobacteriota bacterium]
MIGRILKSLSLGALLFFCAGIVGESLALAGRSGGRSFGSSSFGKSSSWSSSTRGTWNRSGGGLFGGKESSSGYSKPSSTPATSSAPYSKPSVKEPSSGSNYSKPGLQGQTGPAPSGTGYSKPSLTDHGSTSGQKAGSESKTSAGYTKPSSPSVIFSPG